MQARRQSVADGTTGATRPRAPPIAHAPAHTSELADEGHGNRSASDAQGEHRRPAGARSSPAAAAPLGPVTVTDSHRVTQTSSDGDRLQQHSNSY